MNWLCVNLCFFSGLPQQSPEVHPIVKYRLGYAPFPVRPKSTRDPVRFFKVHPSFRHIYAKNRPSGGLATLEPAYASIPLIMVVRVWAIQTSHKPITEVWGESHRATLRRSGVNSTPNIRFNHSRWKMT